MTHKDELIDLKVQLNAMGIKTNFIIGERGEIEQVFLAGRLYDPLTFAEKARPMVTRRWRP